MGSMKTIDRKIDFLGYFIAEATACFLVINLNLIFTAIKIKIFEKKQFLALKKFCSRRLISNISRKTEDSRDLTNWNLIKNHSSSKFLKNDQRGSQIFHNETYLHRLANSHHVGWSPKIEELSLVQLIKSEVKSRRYISSRKPGVCFDFLMKII